MDTVERRQEGAKPLSRTKQLTVIAALVAAAFLAYFLYVRFWPVKTLGDLRLGMSEVEVTLAFGRKADESSTHGKVKQLTFYGAPGYINEVRLAKSGRTYKIYEICSNTQSVESKGIYRLSNEDDVLRKLGKPTYVSVSQDGTVKISSFGSTNLAFMFELGTIREICVSNDLPVRFDKEYAG